MSVTSTAPRSAAATLAGAAAARLPSSSAEVSGTNATGTPVAEIATASMLGAPWVLLWPTSTVCGPSPVTVKVRVAVCQLYQPVLATPSTLVRVSAIVSVWSPIVKLIGRGCVPLPLA